MGDLFFVKFPWLQLVTVWHYLLILFQAKLKATNETWI